MGEWPFRQIFGDRTGNESIEDTDIISAVEFNNEGDFLAVGDNAGRLVVFQEKEKAAYRFYAETQSHEAEFDYLKSIDIEAEIKKICWLNSGQRSRELLATNDRTIKLVCVRNVSEGEEDREVCCIKREFKDGHAYHINSLSACCDIETFLSSDELRVNIWRIEDTKAAFNAIDIKPSAMENISDVITSACFAHTQEDIFVYTLSGGKTNYVDMRCSTSRNHVSKVFVQPREDGLSGDISSAISDACFSEDGSHVIVRDYSSVSVWDIRMETKPTSQVLVGDVLDTRGGDLYEQDLVFDQFQLAYSPCGQRVATGTYGDSLRVYDGLLDSNSPSETEITLNKHSISETSCERSSQLEFDTNRGCYLSLSSADAVLSHRVLNLALHPRKRAAAVACRNNLYIYGDGFSMR